jgi:hypothetical protein
VKSKEPLPELPIFSPRLDEIMGMMVKGQIPNVGRFCGYCYTPLGKDEQRCAHCGYTRTDYAPLAKIPAEFFVLYRNMRKRESLIVNSFAYLGLAIGLALFVVLVAVAVYRYDASWVMLAVATVVFMIGGRVFAGLLGGWIGDNIGYEYAQRKLAVEWSEYERTRDGSTAGGPAGEAPAAGAPAR